MSHFDVNDGTRATLSGRFFKGGGSPIEIRDHLTGEVRVLEPKFGDDLHGGGDTGLMLAFTTAVREGRTSLNGVQQALESHLMAFAAEEARLTGTLVDLDPYRRMAGAKTPHESGDG